MFSSWTFGFKIHDRLLAVSEHRLQTTLDGYPSVPSRLSDCFQRHQRHAQRMGKSTCLTLRFASSVEEFWTVPTVQQMRKCRCCLVIADAEAQNHKCKSLARNIISIVQWRNSNSKVSFWKAGRTQVLRLLFTNELLQRLRFGQRSDLCDTYRMITMTER